MIQKTNMTVTHYQTVCFKVQTLLILKILKLDTSYELSHAQVIPMEQNIKRQ